MEKAESDPKTGCALGVTGKRLRRALPLVSPAPAFRAALKQMLDAGDPGSTPLTGAGTGSAEQRSTRD